MQGEPLCGTGRDKEGTLEKELWDSQGTCLRLGKGGPLGMSLPEACPPSSEKAPWEGYCWEFE